MREKSQGSSSGDKTFDFKYKIDISDRKGKTGETFKQESGFDFDDFKDFRQDRTQKSEIHSQKKWLPSDLVKKSQQSLIITENPTELSIKQKGGSFMADNFFLKGENFDGQANFASYGASPKFNDQKIYQTVSNAMFSKAAGRSEMTSSQKSKVTSKMSIQLPQKPIQTQLQDKPANKFTSPKFPQQTSYNVSSSRQRPQASPTRLSPQSEYQQILSSIQYYQNYNEKLDYETARLMEQMERYQRLLEDNPQDDFEMEKLVQQTYLINTAISQQRSLERTLIQQKGRLEDEFDQLVNSVQSMQFQRPVVLRDQTKAVIDEINSLKSEFQALKRDQGSLNFSTTLLNPNLTSLQTRTQQPFPIPQNPFNPESTLLTQSLHQILKHSSSHPNYIYNIKMLAIKDEWKLYEDTEICVSCSTRDYPMTEIRVGNKSGRMLAGFSMREGVGLVVQREGLQAKSYFVHGVVVAKVSQPFLPIQIEYKSNLPSSSPTEPATPKKLVFFIPTLPLKHGQFIPITAKQYQKQSQQHHPHLSQQSILEKPIDSQLIRQSLQQLSLYFPNLLYERTEKGEQICKGIFRLWNSSQGSLVQIRKRDNRVSIFVRNCIGFLLQSLEFLCTLVV